MSRIPARPERPLLSVIVPIRNESPHIRATLGQLLDQTLDASAYEIIIADGRSEDRSREIVEEVALEAPNVFLVDNPGRRSSSGRNAGARIARGDYLLFVDGHCRIPSRSMLEEILDAFLAGCECVSRPQPLVAGSSRRTARAIVLTRTSVFGHVPGSCIYESRAELVDPKSAGCGYTKELFWRLGGFDESFDAAEDVEFNLRVGGAGVRALHSSGFAVEYIARDRLSSLGYQMYRYGRGRGRLLRRGLEGFSLATVAPALLLMSLAVLLVASLFDARLIPVLGVKLLLGLIVAVVLVALVASRSGIVVGLLSIPAILAILSGAGVGVLVGLSGRGAQERETLP